MCVCVCVCARARMGESVHAQLNLSKTERQTTEFLSRSDMFLLTEVSEFRIHGT
jgi:hypothetical protein